MPAGAGLLVVHVVTRGRSSGSHAWACPGSAPGREAVRAHLRAASAVVGMQVLMSAYDESVAAANAIIDFLEQRESVLTQIDTVGWYDGPELILKEPD